MSNYADILNALIVRTKRPTMTKEFELAIAMGTARLHNSGFFIEDLTVTNLVSASGAKLEFDVDFAKNPHIRAIAKVFIQKEDGTQQALEHRRIGSDTLRDTNYYRYTGSKLYIRTAQPQNAFAVEHYTLPKVDRVNYDSWIAIKYPYMVIEAAYEQVCRDLGLMDEAQVAMSKIGNENIKGSYIHRLHAQHCNLRPI